MKWSSNRTHFCPYLCSVCLSESEMPKRKQEAPRKLNQDEQKVLAFNLGENENSTSNVLQTGTRKAKNKRRLQEEDQELKRILENCDFYLTVFTILDTNCVQNGDKSNFPVAKLGNLRFSCQRKYPEKLPQTEKCWLYVSEEDAKGCMIYFEYQTGTENYVQYYMLEEVPPYQVLHAVQTMTVFSLALEEYKDGVFEVGVWIKERGLSKVKYKSDAFHTEPRRDIQCVIGYFYHKNVEISMQPKKVEHLDLEELYSVVQNIQRVQHVSGTIDVQHPKLLPKLRPYQEDAVRWMLAKEQYDPTSNEDLDSMYEAIWLPCGKQMYYNRFGGYLCQDMPISAPRIPGGILADEMGLGKTVEVLSLVLCNPRPEIIASDPEMLELENENCCVECICGCTIMAEDDDDNIQCRKCGLWQHKSCVNYSCEQRDYFCPHCWVTMEPVVSRATLIVVPSTIGHQWVEEVDRHVGFESLKLLVYKGVHNMGFIQPPILADNDVVVITYDVMRKELDYVDLPSDLGSRLRKPKRYMSVPSPLVAVDWWRVCLDEAQTVECPTAKTALMALKLTTVNRWCITGTPIQKTLQDLYGLVLFLGVEPYWQAIWWRRCLLEPYYNGDRDPMHRTMVSVMWRTAKKDVVDQISIPCQTEELHWLTFSPVEEHFYRRQHADCSQLAVRRLDALPNLDLKLDSLDKQTLAQVLAPLLRLRQACCHPQAVSGNFMALKKETMTMEALLETLIKKAKLESEEAHRQLVSSLNGLAGIHLIRREWPEAAEMYREVLRSVDEHSARVKTDKLQRLHALQNLAELLDAGHSDIPPTLRDDKLVEEAENLRAAYLAKRLQKVRDCREHLRRTSEAANQCRSGFICTPAWWISTITWAIRANKDRELVKRIRDDSTKTGGANRFRDAKGLQLTLLSLLDELDSAYEALSKAIGSLEDEPSSEDINSAVECHLRPVGRKPNLCLYCRIDEELFDNYERVLFKFTQEAKRMDNEDRTLLGQLRRGTWADSETEIILKAILAFARAQEVPNEWIKDGEQHVKLFDAMKKEFRGLRGVWMQLRDQVSALDELNMAAIRLRLRFDDEPVAVPPQPNVLEWGEVGHHEMKLRSDRIVGNNELQRKLGQLLYLENLSKNEAIKSCGSNPDPCPICQVQLGHQWSVLQCGHCFCVECIRVLITRFSFGGRQNCIKCAVCRQMTGHGQISYVNTKGENSEEENCIQVKGSHSTKIEAVVRTLLRIKQKDPGAKVLVFSSWITVLEVLTKALDENDVSYGCLYSHCNFQGTLESFKRRADVTALLMCVQSKSNGLNLIEATHVILVEPILNTASELQAIGRVHRIGQTRPTVVHRFVVRRTIEERMHEILNTRAGVNCGTGNELTLMDLRSIFQGSNLLNTEC